MSCNAIVNAMVCSNSNVSQDTQQTIELHWSLSPFAPPALSDFYHVIAGGFPVSVSGEVVVKWFELANMGLPVAALSAVFGPLRLSSGRRARLLRSYVPWALKCGSSARPLISVEWEAHWERPIEELRQELGIWAPPLDWESWKQEENRIKREAQSNAAWAFDLLGRTASAGWLSWMAMRRYSWKITISKV